MRTWKLNQKKLEWLTELYPFLRELQFCNYHHGGDVGPPNAAVMKGESSIHKLGVVATLACYEEVDWNDDEAKTDVKVKRYDY